MIDLLLCAVDLSALNSIPKNEALVSALLETREITKPYGLRLCPAGDLAGNRQRDEQLSLFLHGRLASGTVKTHSGKTIEIRSANTVTNDDGYNCESSHQHGDGIDLGFRPDAANTAPIIWWDEMTTEQHDIFMGCVEVMEEHGWHWGGHWHKPDFHHFYRGKAR